MNETLAVKYRPKSLNEVVGQEVVVQIIKNSFNMNKLHHAYILDGPFGTGKTSLARIMALLLNTGIDIDSEVNLESKQVRDILNGSSIDVCEIDAASNNGVDDIRNIKENAKFSPVQGKNKVFILDETHMLSKSAFNAMLKILEEPPPHTFFILCTTETNKIPDTIKSRCLQLNLYKLDWREIHNRLFEIARKEYEADEDAIAMIAKASNGSMRSALNLLEKTHIYSAGKKITLELANKASGVSDNKKYYKLIKSIFTKDVSSSIQTINQIILMTNNSEYILNRIEELLVNILNAKICQDIFLKESISEEEIKIYQHLSKFINVRLATRIIELLIEARRGLEYNMDIQCLIETWAINSIMEIQKFTKNKSEN